MSLIFTLKEIKIYFHTKICSQMLTTARFLIFPNWKQQRCPSKGEWTKSYDKFTHWYFRTIMSNLLLYTRTWIYLKTIIMHEAVRDNRIHPAGPFITNINRGRTLLKIRVTRLSISLQEGFQTFNPEMEECESKYWYILKWYLDHVYVLVEILFWEEILCFHYRNW